MLLLLSRPHIHPRLDNLGMLARPRAGNRPQHAIGLGLSWAADNSAYSGFNEQEYMNMMILYQPLPKPLWVCAPDVVGDAVATLALFTHWQPVIASYGYPVALVAQDGLQDEAIPWDGFDCLFIGGSTAWKLGAQCRAVVSEAKRRNKLVHMGRVNSARRLRYAQSIGCDSVDGSSYDRIPSKVALHLPILRTSQESYLFN